MKIGFIEPGLHVCGGIRRIMEVSNRLSALNHEVLLFTPTGNPCTWLPSPVPIKKLSNLHRYKFDVIIFNLAENYEWALQAKAKKKIFWVLAPEAMYKRPKVPIKALHHDFYLLANSKFTVTYIKRHAPSIKQKEIPIIPGGINPEHFHYVPTIPQSYHVMYYNSQRPWKGANLVEAALRSTPLKLRKMEGSNTPQNRMYQLYNGSTCYVSAGLVEGFNFPILEAMACGCPVVCTDDGGNNDFVRNGENAIVVPRTIPGIQDGVTRVLNDKPLRRQLRSAGLKTAAQDKYKWENVVSAFEAALKN